MTPEIMQALLRAVKGMTAEDMEGLPRIEMLVGPQLTKEIEMTGIDKSKTPDGPDFEIKWQYDITIVGNDTDIRIVAPHTDLPANVRSLVRKMAQVLGDFWGYKTPDQADRWRDILDEPVPSTDTLHKPVRASHRFVPVQDGDKDKAFEDYTEHMWKLLTDIPERNAELDNGTARLEDMDAILKLKAETQADLEQFIRIVMSEPIQL